MLKDHNAVTPVRLEPAALRSPVKRSTTEPLRKWTGPNDKSGKSHSVHKFYANLLASSLVQNGSLSLLRNILILMPKLMFTFI